MAQAIIKDFDAKLFNYNGIKYVRNFIAIKIGNTVRIVNAYDTRFTLIVAPYTSYIVNGATFLDVDSLISVLSPMLFVKDELTMTGNGEAINTTVVSFSEINGVWVNSPVNPIITNTLTLDVTNAKSGSVASVYYKGNVLDKTKILGGTIVSFNGVNVLNELCFIWISYDKINSSFHVNIQTGFTGDMPAIGGETAPIITITDIPTTETAPIITVN